MVAGTGLPEPGIDVVHGSVWADPLDPAAILTPRDKVRLVETERDQRGLPRDRCVAYGDSGTDGPLFAHLEHTVAVNAQPVLRGAADYRGDDLREAYALGRGLLDGAAGVTGSGESPDESRKVV